ncbi:hypothetical protein BD413DRAFT_179184 [Trametes elegans]|nr:hypothetical protein BD413DRAFT_179184 [Trametes elegans]
MSRPGQTLPNHLWQIISISRQCKVRAVIVATITNIKSAITRGRVYARFLRALPCVADAWQRRKHHNAHQREQHFRPCVHIRAPEGGDLFLDLFAGSRRAQRDRRFVLAFVAPRAFSLDGDVRRICAVVPSLLRQLYRDVVSCSRNLQDPRCAASALSRHDVCQ